MNVITLASRKGGAGKSTLTAHLAACAHSAGHRCLVIDADPQGSLTLWHSLRRDDRLKLQTAARGIDRALAFASIEGYEWVFIDTAPTMWVVVQEAIRAATLVVIPARPGFFDLNAGVRQRQTSGTVQFHNRFFVSRHGFYEIRLCLRQITIRLQHQIAGGSAQGFLLLLDIEGLLGQGTRLARSFYPRPILQQSELRVADFDPNLILQLLQM